MKLSKAAREGGCDKFAFFVTDGSAANDFKSVYDLQMQVDALITSLTLYNMLDVFQVLEVTTVEQLEVCTEALIGATDALANADEDDNSEVMRATTDVLLAEDNLAALVVIPKNLLKDFKDVSMDDIRATNRYYTKFGADYVFKNLQRSEDIILATCEPTLRGEVR